MDEQERDEQLRRWLDDVSRTFETTALDATPTAAVDASDGRLLGQSPAVREVIGCTLPERIADLVDLGVVARPDFAALQAQVGALATLPPDLGSVGHEAAHSWSTQLRIHPPGGPSRVVEVQIAHHQRPGLGAQVVWATLAPVGEPAADATPLPATSGLRFTSVLDRQARIVATGPQARRLWADLESLVGKVCTAMVHPEDLPVVLPAANAVFAGRVDRAAYTVRMAVDGGRWVHIESAVERVVTAEDHLLVIDNRVIDSSRRMVPPGVLSAREFAIVVGLFDGLRISQLAERDGVAAKTIRNQLVSVHRKLGVSGQAELLATYHRPNRR